VLSGALAGVALGFLALRFIYTERGRGIAALFLRQFRLRKEMLIIAIVVAVPIWALQLFVIYGEYGLPSGLQRPWLVRPWSELMVAWFVAPLIEEIIFRGLIFYFLRSRFGLLAAVAVTSLLFASAHEVHSVAVLAFFFLCAVSKALIAVRTRSLTPAILAHAADNVLFSALAFC